MGAVQIIGYVLAVLVGSIFITEMLKVLVEKNRVKHTAEKVFKSGEEEKTVRYFVASGAEYKKLKGLYQGASFLLAFAGISCLLIFLPKLSGFNIYKDTGAVDLFSLFKTLGVAMLLAGTEAKLYELYEGAGLRGLFRWIIERSKSAGDVKALIGDTKEPNLAEIAKGVGEDIKQLVEEKKALVKEKKVKAVNDVKKLVKEKKVKVKEKDVVSFYAQKTGQSEAYISAILNNIKKK